MVFAEREPNENRPFAFGADATRRINRVALAPIALGDRGLARDADGGEGGEKDICDAFAVCGTRDLPDRDLSALMVPRSLPSSSPSLIVSIPSPGCCEKYDGVLGVRREEFLDGRLFESVDNDEWYDDRWSLNGAAAGASV